LDVRHPPARLIVPALPEPGDTVRLAPAEAAHARARRLVAGDAVLLLDGSGRTAAAQVVRLTGDEMVVAVSSVMQGGASGPGIALFAAGLRAEKLAWMVEKATELGISAVTIVESERTQGFRASESLLPRLERVARESAKQCERADWPRIAGPVPLAQVLEHDSSAHRFFFDHAGARFPDRLPAEPSAIVIGPEGGWTDSERIAASSKRWSVVRLPAGKLRAETAAIAALVLFRAAIDAEKQET
jgi:16S rRNA (uracil1498-N3)-methyltransferase